MWKSRFQLVNYGRPRKPCWAIIDILDGNRYIFSDRRRGAAEGLLRLIRREERERARKEKNGETGNTGASEGVPDGPSGG